MKFDSRFKCHLLTAAVLLTGATQIASADSNSCAQDPLQPHAEFEITDTGLNKLIQAGVQTLQGQLSSGKLIKIPTSESFGPMDPKKCTPEMLAKIPDLQTAYTVCPGVPKGLLAQSVTAADYKKGFTPLAQVEPANFKLNDIKLENLKFAPIQASCQKAQCDVTVALDSFAAGTNMEADAVNGGQKLMGVKGIEMGMSGRKDKKGNVLPVVTVHLRANILPNGTLTDFIEVPKDGVKINIDPTTAYMKLNGSKADRQAAGDFLYGDSNKIPPQFENEASMDAWFATQTVFRKLKNPDLINSLTKQLSQQAATYLNSQIKQQIADIPVVNHVYRTTLPRIKLQDLIDLNAQEAVSDLMASDAKNLLAQQAGQKVSSPVSAQVLSAEFGSYLTMSQKMNTVAGVGDVDQQLSIWTNELGQIKDPTIKAQVADFVKKLTIEKARLDKIATDKQLQLELEVSAYKLSKTRDSILFSMATCLPCLAGKMQTDQRIPQDIFPAKKDYDFAAHFTYDYGDTLLADLNQHKDLDFCVNMSKNPGTCSTAGPKDYMLQMQMTKPPTIGYDAKKGAYLELHDAQLKFVNGLQGYLGSFDVNGKIFVNLAADNSKPASELDFKATNLGDVNIKENSKMNLPGDVAAWAASKQWVVDHYQQYVLSAITGAMDIPANARLDNIQASVNGIDAFATMSPSTPKDIVSSALH